MPLPTIAKNTKVPQNVKKRMDEPRLRVTDSTLQNVPIDPSTLSSVYGQVGNTAKKTCGAVVVDTQTGSVLLDLTKSVD